MQSRAGLAIQEKRILDRRQHKVGRKGQKVQEGGKEGTQEHQWDCHFATQPESRGEEANDAEDCRVGAGHHLSQLPKGKEREWTERKIGLRQTHSVSWRQPAKGEDFQQNNRHQGPKTRNPRLQQSLLSNLPTRTHVLRIRRTEIAQQLHPQLVGKIQQSLRSIVRNGPRWDRQQDRDEASLPRH